jgi:hypothetical protein
MLKLSAHFHLGQRCYLVSGAPVPGTDAGSPWILLTRSMSYEQGTGTYAFVQIGGDQVRIVVEESEDEMDAMAAEIEFRDVFRAAEVIYAQLPDLVEAKLAEMAAEAASEALEAQGFGIGVDLIPAGVEPTGEALYGVVGSDGRCFPSMTSVTRTEAAEGIRRIVQAGRLGITRAADAFTFGGLLMR